MQNKKLPIGIDDFEKLINEGFFYVDKTLMIKSLLSSWSEVNLFTRPRRFGKSLNLSMLFQFFDVDSNKAIFDGLNILREKELVSEHMGKHPVIFLSLKSIEGETFDSSFNMLKILMRGEVRRIKRKIGENNLSKEEIEYLSSFIDLSASLEEYKNVFKGLSEIMSEHYGTKVIILLDEYDVPLDKAYLNGYYDEMVSFLRGLFGNAFKTNKNLLFAVLTGCMRVSKESIFTGINNLDANTIIDNRHDEYFGFTEAEVDRILDFYHIAQRKKDIQEWYDGYRFGHEDIYCPWDVICAVKKLTADPEAEMQPFWINTSGNDIIRRFINKSDRNTRDEIEKLLSGEVVEKRINMELTYRDIDRSIDNLWSVLFVTGYLTVKEKPKNGIYKLSIPNKELRGVFVSEIKEWFSEEVINEDGLSFELTQALMEGKQDRVESLLNDLLSKTISVLDTNGRRGKKENFYHGILLGIIAGRRNWLCKSNSESGDGFSDIVVYTDNHNQGIVIEVKYSDSPLNLGADAEQAINQIEEKNYRARFLSEGIEDILSYGIAFNKKRCKVLLKEMKKDM